MAVQETRTLPPQFIEDVGTDLAKQLVAQTGRPVVAPGAGGITQLAGEDAAQFAARQKEAQQFDIRQQSLAGLAPTVAGQDPLQQQAQTLAQQGIGSYQPFLQQAQTQAQLASGLGTVALGGLGTAGQELTGAGTSLAGAQQALGTAGTTNTGGGGGGGSNIPNTSPAGDGGPGGSGIVIIRYKFQ